MSFRSKFGQLITKIIEVVDFVALLTMMAVVSANVIGRGFFAQPVLGTVEIVGLAGVFLIPLAIILTERERAHVTIKIKDGVNKRCFGDRSLPS